MHFEKGVITFWASGAVFGTYEFIDSDRVRFKQSVEDSETVTIYDDHGNDQEFEMPTVKHVDVIVFVEFQSDDRMPGTGSMVIRSPDGGRFQGLKSRGHPYQQVGLALSTRLPPEKKPEQVLLQWLWRKTT